MVAVMIALLGTALIVLYVKGIDQRATEGQEMVEVLTASATIETPGAALAAAGDFVSQPLPPEAQKQIPLPFMTGLKAARVVATFKDGVQIAGSLTYPEAASAETASQSVKQTANLTKWLAVFGIKVNNIDIKVDKTDVQFSLGVDDQSLRQLLVALPQWLG